MNFYKIYILGNRFPDFHKNTEQDHSKLAIAAAREAFNSKSYKIDLANGIRLISALKKVVVYCNKIIILRRF